ncbi:MAG TPA: UDP-N-acetylmuramoyl-tripeptide--D-alanyl-D-alanine ligase [Nitrospirota bacterium]|nr:UDP-N-acetylmuramoyl-tripeptide--D-alanyl-D-alanine ligase [Nitrospirota bacterium]
MKESEKKMLDEILGRFERMEIKGISIDSRTIKEGELFVAIQGDRFDGHDFVPEVIKKGAWGALVERIALEKKYGSLGGLKNILPVEDTILALQEMSQRHRKKFDIPVIGITGSNGKTTTKEMLACILRQRGPVLKNEGNLNNHIGVPLTLLKLDGRHRSAAIEMGMSALGEIDTLARIVRPDVGMITNIGPAHLEFLGTLGTVAQAKAELLRNLKSDGTAVLNADDPFFNTLKNAYDGRILSFGIKNRSNVSVSNIRQGQDFTDIAIEADGLKAKVRLPAVGRHNVYNALAAAAGALAVGLQLEAVKDGLEGFSPVSMRSELKQVKGRTVLADYYNANPGSVQAALETLISLTAGKSSVAVLGDMLELGEAAADAHREVGRIAARLGIDVLITLGTLAKCINEGALEAGMPQDRVISAGSHGEAAAMLKERSKNGDAVLIKGSRAMKMEKILEEF